METIFFLNCTKAKKCPKQDCCEGTHNALHHGAERIFAPKKKKHQVNPMSPNRKMLNMFPLMALWGGKITKKYQKYLPIATVGVSSDSNSAQTLVLCDGVSAHSWVSASQGSRLKFVVKPVHFSISGFNAVKVIETQRVKFNVSSEPNNADLSFTKKVYVKDNIHLGTECINIPELQDKYPQLD